MHRGSFAPGDSLEYPGDEDASLNSIDEHGILKRLKDTHFILALLWGFFSALLAGNWQFSFQNRQIQFEFWIIFTVFLIAFPFLILAFLGIRRLINRSK